jgi:Domain of unknown function (DUF4126)
MPVSVESLVAVAVGIGLAAATGFRVFLPLLVAGLVARWGGLSLAPAFQWLSSPGALIALSTASVVEVVAYYIPGVDHVLDLVASPAAIVAGAIASASVMVDVPPEIMWPMAIIGGGGAAGLTKFTSAVLRTKSALFTGGLVNPVVSTGETISAVGIAIAAILVPVICLIFVAVLVTWIVRRLRVRVPA